MIPEVEHLLCEVMELSSVLGRVNGDIEGWYLVIEALTDRGNFTEFSSLHLRCKSVWRDLLFLSSSIIPVSVNSILVLKVPLVFPNNFPYFSTKQHYFLGLTVLASYCFMFIDENLR